MRKWLLMMWLGVLLAGVSYIFWHEDWKYMLPTPIPEGYEAVEPGETVHIPEQVAMESGKPLFLHFYNPTCPCSRFNIPHFRSLVRKFGDRVKFAVVVMHDKGEYTAEELRDRLGIDNIPVYFDSAIADSCGVYSTPQAALIDGDLKLCYRGNYNRSRYCTDKGTYYAQLALDSLMNGQGEFLPITDMAALKSYGCSIPNCTQ